MDKKTRKEIGRFRAKSFDLFIRRNWIIQNYNYINIHYYILANYMIILIILVKMHLINNDIYHYLLFFWAINVLLHTLYYIIGYISIEIFYWKVEKRNKEIEKRNGKN